METEALKPRAVAAASAEMNAAETPRAQRGGKAGVGAAQSQIESNDEGYNYGETYGGCLENCLGCLEPWLPTCVFDCLLSIAKCVYGCLEQICGWNGPVRRGHAYEEDETHHDTDTVRTRESDAVEHDGPANLETSINGIQRVEDKRYIHTKASHIYEITGEFSLVDWNQGDAILIADDSQTPNDGTQNCTNLKTAKTTRVKMYLPKDA